jgi:hypothetical protein
MNKLIYKCSICSKKFPRKWNAQRHNDIHNNAALIEYSSNVKTNLDNRSKIYPYNHDKYKVKTFSSKHDNKNTKDFSTFSYSYAFKSFNNYYQNNSNKTDKYTNETEKEDLLYDKLEKMIIPFEKLEKLLVLAPHLIQGNGNVDTVLSNVIITALGKHDPAKFVQNRLSLYSRLYY